MALGAIYQNVLDEAERIRDERRLARVFTGRRLERFNRFMASLQRQRWIKGRRVVYPE